MQIQKYYRVERPGIEGPHGHYGKFECSQIGERENNLVAGFAEGVWMLEGGRDYAVSFVPSPSNLSFWVNGESERIVRGVIDEAIAKLHEGFKKSGLPRATVLSVSR